MHRFFDWLVKWHVGDVAGIAGLVVSIAGFAITIWQIRRAKSATEMVEVSVKEIRREIEGRAVSLDLSELVRELEEMKEFHRSNLRSMLPSRYTSARRKLIAVRAAYSVLTAEAEKFDSGQHQPVFRVGGDAGFGRWSSGSGKPQPSCELRNQQTT